MQELGIHRRATLVISLACTLLVHCKKVDPQHPVYHCDYRSTASTKGELCSEYFDDEQTCVDGIKPAPGQCERSKAVAGCFLPTPASDARIDWYYDTPKAPWTLESVTRWCPAMGSKAIAIKPDTVLE